MPYIRLGSRSPEALKSDKQKYLTFFLAQEKYGIKLKQVKEIIRPLFITSIPGAPEDILGVMNLRGHVIPVANLRIKFGMPEHPFTDDSRIIIVDSDEGGMGFSVDQVDDMVFLSSGEIDETPNFDVAIIRDYIQGIGKINLRSLIILEIEKILASYDLPGKEVAGNGRSVSN